MKPEDCQPDWYGKPTAPGRWLFVHEFDIRTYGHRRAFDMARISIVTPERMDENWLPGCRWYGPIPDDTK